ncbi:MAG TPA: GAF domain-containing protein, partial [Longimicrobium sp.]|nr:GAF domain-containing protein [Longimicrobium sp.]
MGLVDDPGRLAALRRSGLLDTPPEESFDRLTRLASRFFGVPVALVCFVDRERQFVKSAAGLREPWASRLEMPLEYSYCQHALGSAEPLVIQDARMHPLVRHSPAIAETGAIAYAGVPLTSEGQVLGTLCVVDDRPRAWSDAEIETLRDLAGSAQSEIDLRMAERRARDGEAYLSAVVDAQRAVAEAGLDADSVMRQIVQRTCLMTAAESAVVDLVDGEEMVQRAACGSATAHLGLRLGIQSSLSGLCLRTGEVLRCDDTETDARVDRAAARMVGSRSVVAVPLGSRSQPLGVLKAYAPHPSAFSDAAVQTLKLLAAVLGSALHDAQRFEREQDLVARLRASEQLYRSVFEGTGEGCFLVGRDPDGTFRYQSGNRALGLILGIAVDQFVGRSPQEILPAAAVARVLPIYQHVFETGTAFEIEHNNEIARGAVATRTRYYPLKDDAGAVVRILGMTEDVTEKVAVKREMEAYARELERSNEALQDFAYVASHDLQEPLRKIRTFGNRLQAGYQDALGEQGADYLRRMQAAAERMQGLIKDLLAYSRVSSNVQPFSPVSLDGVVRDVVGDLQARIEDSGAR